MLPPGLRTPREVTLYYDSVYDSLVDSGRAYPFLYPWAGVGAFLILGYLLIDHRQRPILSWFRYPLFIFLFAFQGWVIATNKARHPAAALGVGLLSSWGILWVSTIMVVNHCQTDFERIEKRATVEATDSDSHTSNGSVSNGGLLHASNSTAEKISRSSQSNESSALKWQQYPTSLRDRCDWIADVFCSFRGVGWNWQTTTVPPLPKSIESQLRGIVDSAPAQGDDISTSRIGIRRSRNRDNLLKSTIAKLAVGYMVLDVIKILISHDPYFWGYIDAAPPSYLPVFMQHSHTLIRSYRLLVGLAAMYTALWQIFKLGPLFFCGIVGPEWIGIRGEAWMNPADMFGSFSCILDNGLAGWWGGWWHQIFRAAFEAHSTWLLKKLGIERRSKTGKVVGLFTSFILSGCLHASGSYTLLGDTRPLMGPMRFFLLQPFAILLQMFLAQQLSKVGVLQKTPKWMKQTASFVFVHIWMYFTAPLLIDDFARGGTWLYEPIPISLHCEHLDLEQGVTHGSAGEMVLLRGDRECIGGIPASPCRKCKSDLDTALEPPSIDGIS